jgi:hypothetical protein
MMEVETNHYPEQNHRESDREMLNVVEDFPKRNLELEQLAAQARATLYDALSAINQVIEPTQPRISTRPILSSPIQFHPRTGKIRRPRELDSSDDDTFGAQKSSDEDSHTFNPVFQGMMTTPRKLTPAKRGRPPSAKRAADNIPWVSDATGKWGVNKPKCPPCARLKKKDPCNGQAPCRQCWGKGRRTPEECQEWGENYVPRIRKRRARGSLVKKD